MKEVTSAEQDQWVEICAAARAGIAKLVPLIPAMEPEEVLSLMTAIDTAMWNEAKAATHDEFVAERRASLDRSTIYGG